MKRLCGEFYKKVRRKSQKAADFLADWCFLLFIDKITQTQDISRFLSYNGFCIKNHPMQIGNGA